ncbi:MAG: magnesium transporter CorA family protein [Armatimonadota bacterium]
MLERYLSGSEAESTASGRGAPRVTARLCRPGSDRCEQIPPERISELLQQPGALLWVDVAYPTAAELEMLRGEFGFHRLALEDISRQRQRPKVDEYPSYFFVVMHAPLPANGGLKLEMAELDVFVGGNYVVTSRHCEIPALDDAIQRWERTEPELRGHVGFLLHVIADSVIDAYFPIVDSIEDRLDRIEFAMFSLDPTYNPEELLGVKRALYTLRKAIYPLREVFNVFLRRDQMIFSAETYPYFQDVYDHVLRLLDLIDIERDMATGALESQISVASHRLNETMKRLTVVAVCVAVMGAVFGAWGMNFTAVPLAHEGLAGFAIVTGGTFALVGLVLAWARRIGLW